MNVLFVNYGNFTTNSLNHIAGFAATLQARGHACVVAVPGEIETLAAVPTPRFRAATYAEVLATPALFPDGRPADILHAWTPREPVRKFVLAHQRLAPARLIVHLEDNEDYLLTAFTGQPLTALRELADDELAALLDDALPHPVRYRNFLRVADGVTVITDRLREFAPADLPVTVLPPGVDFTLYHAPAADPALRRELALADGERVLTFTGSTTFANEAEMRTLVTAVHLLNQRGLKTRLVRTGFHPAEFTDRYDFDWRAFTLDLGFVEKTRLPALLALADVLVQPGHAGAFDDYRLPSKLPEFFASGRPVILPATNIASALRDGQDALILSTGTPEEIADLCARVFADPSLARRLGDHGTAFARRHFDLSANTAKLTALYTAAHEARPRADWSRLTALVTESALLPGLLRAQLERLLPADDPRLAAFQTALADLALILRHGDEQLARGPARQLLDQLQAEIASLSSKHTLSEQHAANLQQSLDLTRQALAATKEALATNQEALDRTMAENARVAHANRLYQGELVRARDEASDQQARLNAQIANLHLKIQRQQSTFSWQATAPLRFLRRKLLDPFRAPEPPPPPPPTPAPVARPALDPDYEFHIDDPAHWYVPAGPLTITGWCVGRDQLPVAKIRVCLDDYRVPAEMGQVRADVAERLHNDAAAAAGFRLQLPLAPGTHTLHFEVAGPDQQWHLVATPCVQVFAHAHPTSTPRTYAEWIKQYDRPALADLRQRLEKLPHRPLISVVMPVYNPPAKWLLRAIESVRTQLYTDWELCIADDRSTDPAIRPLLETAARQDPRIKVCFRPVNGHISAASNSALELATGEFIALLDHDDEIPAHALAEVALALAAQPATDLLYSDEDKIDEDGRRFSPYFKPDYLPDLFLGQNYLTHLCVYRAALLRQAGGFRVGYEGSQDWDLALRVTALTTPARILHLPKILYHWRAIPGSTALTLEQKNYPVLAARRALTDHLARTGQNATLLPVNGGHWRVQHPLPPEPPLVSIIIPTRNGLQHLRLCVESLLAKTTYPRYEILVVDNHSDDPATLAYFQEISQRGVRVLPYPHPFNYSAINNFAVREARGELLAFLNNDLEVITPDWLEEMASQALRPAIGAVGAMLYYPNDTIQHAGVVLGIGGVAGHAFKQFPRGTDGAFNRARLVQNYSAVTAACLVIRKTLFTQVGGFDETALKVAFNDIDFCLKVRATGVANLWTPFAEFYHHESATRGTENTPAKQKRFQGEVETMLARWGDTLRSDPAYNPNLSHESEDFSLAFPPVTRRPAAAAS